MTALIDMTGQRYGRMLVLARAGYLGPHIGWSCRCDCGTEKVVRGHHLRNGVIVSCGCRRDEASGGRVRTHGESRNRSSEYSSWANMLHRCSEHSSGKDRRNYFERGIVVCERWRSFEAFLADIGRKPSPRHSIERNDNDRGYEPDNCRWALPVDQGNNRRGNRIVRYKGQKLTLKQAWGLSGKVISYRQASARVLHLGWPVHAALETPALTPSGKRPAGSQYWQKAA